MLLQLANKMNNFNKNFFTLNTSYTREMAEQRLLSLGYLNFTFNSASFSNGSSFYFTSDKGETLRVSDHALTGKRAFETIQIRIVESKTLPTNRKRIESDFMAKLNAKIAAKNK